MRTSSAARASTAPPRPQGPGQGRDLVHAVLAEAHAVDPPVLTAVVPRYLLGPLPDRQARPGAKPAVDLGDPQHRHGPGLAVQRKVRLRGPVDVAGRGIVPPALAEVAELRQVRRPEVRLDALDQVADQRELGLELGGGGRCDDGVEGLQAGEGRDLVLGGEGRPDVGVGGVVRVAGGVVDGAQRPDPHLLQGAQDPGGELHGGRVVRDLVDVPVGAQEFDLGVRDALEGRGLRGGPRSS